MKYPLQISFRNLERSEHLEAIIREKAARLERFADHIMSCGIMVEMPHNHHRMGNHYHVRIDLTVPGEEIVVNREPAAHIEHQDLSSALRDSLDAARRQLEDYIRRRHGHIKHHDGVPHARVSRLFPEEGYGFLTTTDGREIYFHRNSALNGDFERLQLGSEVSFVEEAGSRGPQASTVRLVGRHGGV